MPETDSSAWSLAFVLLLLGCIDFGVLRDSCLALGGGIVNGQLDQTVRKGSIVVKVPQQHRVILARSINVNGV